MQILEVYQLFQDQYLAQMAQQRAMVWQSRNDTFAATPALVGSNK